MFKLGEKQKLRVARIVSFGVYLTENDQQPGEPSGIPGADEEGHGNFSGMPGTRYEASSGMSTDHKRGQRAHSGKRAGEEEVLLPKLEVPEGVRVGDELDVFLYRDSQDRLIATTAQPALTLYHTAVLKVKQVSRVGAFLDWGLPKDLLLPFHEQTKKVGEGEDCLVALYVDKSDRLCATMKVYHYLKKHSPYQMGDQVTGRIYEISGNFGVFVAVDDQYSALIPKQEAAGKFQVNEIISARVTQVKEDGKLNLSVRKKAYLQMDDDAETVMKVIEEYAGVLPFSENASPEVIRREIGLTKNAFKRALGRLYKERRIVIGPDRVYTAERAPKELR